MSSGDVEAVAESRQVFERVRAGMPAITWIGVCAVSAAGARSAV
jgi:hypothetical protein